MIICFDCPSNIKRLLDSMISNGEYADYGEAIISAIQNLLIIQGEVKKKGVACLGNDVEDDEHVAVNQSAEISSSHKKDILVKEESKSRNSIGSLNKQKSSIPAIFTLENLECDLSEIPEIEAIPPGEIKEYPVNQWIFGMYNRLLPAKANCRALARLITERGGHGIPIKDQVEKVAYDIAKEAALLRDYLRKHDKNFNLKRDDGLSTAFPGSALKDEKSRLRYANQFVARVDKNMDVSGLLIDYRFIEKTDANQVMRLTKPGWEFALLENPILDKSQDNPKEKFTSDEMNFLSNHIINFVASERFAVDKILRLISEGENTPQGIDEALLSLYMDTEKQDKKTSRIASQRSGVISRMVDAGLLIRKRNGISIFYDMTRHGEDFLQKVKM